MYNIQTIVRFTKLDWIVAQPVTVNLNFSVVQTFHTRSSRRFVQQFHLRAFVSEHVE